MGVSQQRCHVCCSQTGKPGRWEIKAEGNKFLQKHIPACRGYRLSSSDPATPSAWTRTRGSQHRDGLQRQQKKTSLSQQEIWSLALQRNTQRPCQEKLHLTRHPHLHVCKFRAACICLCAGVTWSAKTTKSTLLCVLFWTWPRLDSACCFSPQPLPLKLKSLPLLRHGLILNRYTENSCLEWFRNQTGRSVFTGVLTEQLGKGQCQICTCFLSPAAVFFLCQECKESHWLCSCCQCVCTEGQGREKAESGGRGDLTTIKISHFWTWAFLLCQDSPCTSLCLKLMMCELSKEEIADSGADAGRMGKDDISHWSQSPHAGGSAKILVHRQPVLLYPSKEGAKLLLRWLGSCLEPGSCWAALQHPSVPGTLLPALPSELYLREGSSQSTCQSSASLLGVLIYLGGVSLPPVLLNLPSMQVTSQRDLGIKLGI